MTKNKGIKMKFSKYIFFLTVFLTQQSHAMLRHSKKVFSPSATVVAAFHPHPRFSSTLPLRKMHTLLPISTYGSPPPALPSKIHDTGLTTVVFVFPVDEIYEQLVRRNQYVTPTVLIQTIYSLSPLRLHPRYFKQTLNSLAKLAVCDIHETHSLMSAISILHKIFDYSDLPINLHPFPKLVDMLYLLPVALWEDMIPSNHDFFESFDKYTRYSSTHNVFINEKLLLQNLFRVLGKSISYESGHVLCKEHRLYQLLNKHYEEHQKILSHPLPASWSQKVTAFKKENNKELLEILDLIKKETSEDDWFGPKLYERILY